ncbi:MAG TPA: AbrB/MazE/SpoVT family DNA-binding domain-containing protein [Trebonia sp.]|nr:AbrB/MazE/SpoVT family DNA-binding domain-containing protein [Trebonia sp.]
MTAQPLAPVIPSSGVPTSRQHARPAAARRLPLASPVPVPSPPEGVVYGIARIDSSGRICERAIVTALGWAGGDRLTFTADAGLVTARLDPGGMVTLPASGYITIPAALRRRCGLEAGDQVLLAALPEHDSLAAYSLAVVDQAIRAHGSFRHLQGGRP